MSSKQIKGPIEADGSYIKFEKGAATEVTLQTGANMASAVFTLPDATDTLVGKASTDTFTNKSIDGDTNTVTDLPVTAIKTVLGDAYKAIVRDSSGVPTSALILNANIASAAGIALNKLAAMTASKIVATDTSGFLTPTSVAESDLAALSGISGNIQTQLNAKVASNASIVGATKTKITYDSKGLVTAGADIAASDLPTAIDAAKIADGSVSNTEFQYLDGVTSNIQTQITARATTSALSTHIADVANPHAVTKAQVGLSNVDNTSNATERAATATLTNKTLTSPVITTPTGIVKGDVGLGNVDNTSDSTKNAATVQLTNKDIDGGTASNTSRITVPKASLSTLTALTRKQATVAYDTTSNKLVVDNGTSLVAVGSGSGGTKNYITNPNDAAAGWTASGAGVTVTTESTTSNLPDNSTQTTGIKILWVSGTTAYVYTRWTMDAVDYTVLGQIIMDAITAAAAGTFQVQLWTNTASNYAGTSTQVTLSGTNVPTGTSKFAPTGAAGAATSPYMELRIVATAAGTLYLNNVTYTPTVVYSGISPGTEWTSYTPTFGSFTSVTSINMKWRRVGSSMEIQGYYTVGSTGASGIQIFLPPGYTIATPGSATVSLGNYLVDQASNSYYFVLGTAGNTYLQVGREDSTGVLNRLSGISGGGLGTGVHSFTTHPIPIAEWAGQTLTQGTGAKVEYAYFTGTVDADGSGTGSNSALGTAGATMSALTDQRNKYCVWATPPQPGDVIRSEVSTDAGNSWSEESYAWTNNATSTSTAGVRYIGTTSNVSRFLIGRYANDTTAWASNFLIRFKKFNPTAPVGVKAVDTDAPGYARAYSSLARIRLNTGNGYGSTNTKIRRFTNAVVNAGTGLTYADSSTLGASFTCTEAGVYSFTYTDCFSAAGNFGLSLNSSQLTTNISSITTADIVTGVSTTPAATTGSSVSVALTLAVGDVVRAHTDGTSESIAPSRVALVVQRLS